MRVKNLLLEAVFFIVAICLLVFFGWTKNAALTVKPAVSDEELKKSVNISIFSDEKDVANPLPITTIRQPVFPDVVCNIADYGAVGDGTVKNTAAFEKAIADCARRGGGQVLVPDGKWLTGHIHLLSDINLHLSDNATIVFSSDPADYLPAVFSRYEGIEYNGFSAFIYAQDATNIAITGKGKIDGQGQLWWPRNNMKATYALYDMAKNKVSVENRNFTDEKLMLRPSFVQFARCKSVLLEDFTVQDSPMWTIHPLYSSDMIIRNIRVNTLGLNTDGIAVDSSRNILIEDSAITSGDDAIVIKSGRDRDGLRVNIPSENIVIRGCHMLTGHSGIAIGSEVSGGIRNVFAYNSDFVNTNFGLRIKSSVGRGGTVENIWAQNITADRINNSAIQLTTNYDAPYSPDYTDISTIRNISIENMKVRRAGKVIAILGSPDKPIENISFDNISIGSDEGTTLLNTKNVSLKNVSTTIKTNPLFSFTDSSGITLENSPCGKSLKYCASINGDGSKDFTFKNNDFSLSKIIFADGAQKEAVSMQ